MNEITKPNILEVLNIDSDNKQHITSDYERSRATLSYLLEESKDVLDKAKDIVEATEHPKAIEAYSVLLENIAKLNDRVMDLHLKRKTLKERKSHREAPETVTNNNLFVGSTAELQKKIIEDLRLSNMKEVNKDNEP